MKNRKTSSRYIVVLMLLLLLLGLMAFLALSMKSPDEKKGNTNSKMDTMTIQCPKLSGAADAFLLQYRQQAILIDTGLKEDADTILTLLEENGVTSLDALILTHYDKDHIGSAAAILEKIPVDILYCGPGSKDSEEYASLQEAIGSEEVKVCVITDVTDFQALGGHFTIYPPRVSEYDKDTDNNLSLITSIAFKGKRLLFPGDAQMARTEEYLKYQYDGNSYDFLKINHHGRSSKASKALIEQLQPSYGIMTSSQEEAADGEVLEILSDSGMEYYDTKDGSVTVFIAEDGITMERE